MLKMYETPDGDQMQIQKEGGEPILLHQIQPLNFSRGECSINF